MVLAAQRDGEPLSISASVASLAEEHAALLGGRIRAPEGVELIEPVLPGLVFGLADEPRLAIGFATDASGRVRPELWTEASRAPGSVALFESEPTRLVVPVVNQATSGVMASLVVDRAVVRLEDPAGPAWLTGELSTEAVVAAVVAIGGFDAQGARSIVASLLGFTAETLPPSVAFVVEYALR